MRLLAHDNNQLSRDDLAEELPVRWLDNIFVVNRDHSMGLAWRISPPYLDLFGEGEKDAMHDGWRTLLHSLNPRDDTPRANLQVIFESYSPKDDEFLKAFHRTATHPFLNALIEEKRISLQQQFAQGNLRLMACYVILTYHSGVTAENADAKASHEAKGKAAGIRNRLGNSIASTWEEFVLRHFNYEKMGRYSTDQYTTASKKLLEIADSVHLKLQSMGLQPEVLEGDGAVDLLHRFNHPKSYEEGQRARHWERNDYLPLGRYYLSGGADRKPGSSAYLYFDDAYHKILTVRNPPQVIDFTVWDGILQHQGIHRIRVISTFKPETIEARKRHLKDKADIAIMKAQKDTSLQHEAKDIQSALEDLGTGLESAWWGRSVIHVWGNTKEEVDQTARAVLNAAQASEGFEIVPEDIATWDYWTASQPFWTRQDDVHRDIVFNSRQAATHIPCVGQDTMLKRPNQGVLYETGTGSVFNLYLHADKPVPGGVEFQNYNAIVCGGAGSGKTFFVNDFLGQLSPLNPHIICIDFKKPGSFRAMAMARGGNYIDFDLESEKNCINPFDLAPGTKLTRDHIDAWVDSLAKRIADPAVNQGMVSEEQRTVLERVLNEKIVQSDGRPFILQGYYDLLAKHSPELSRRLQPWIGEGRYSKLANGESNISLDNPFTVFDFEKIVDNRYLCKVMFATVVTHAMNCAVQRPGPKFLVFDEAWEFFEDEVMAQFIVRAFRVLRAAGFSVIAISQGIEDFTKLKNKNAILGNINHSIVLRQNTPDAAQALATQLQFNSREVARAMNLQMVSGKFSQALVVQKRTDGRRISVVINNRASPLSYWACTSKKAERDFVRNQVASGKSYFQALQDTAKQYPYGML